MLSADQVIALLGLQAHPEGGYFRETYRASASIPADALPAAYGGPRAQATSIYFLLRAGQYSALHRLRSDEQWHYHGGAPLEVTSIAPDGTLARQALGMDLAAGQRPWLLVPAGQWFGARPLAGAAWSLMSCTVAPGFDFADFELADRAALTRQFPQHAAGIAALTPAPA